MISFMRASRLMRFFEFFTKYSNIRNSVFVRRTSLHPFNTVKFFISILSVPNSIIFVLHFCFSNAFEALFITAFILAISSRGENGFDT